MSRTHAEQSTVGNDMWKYWLFLLAAIVLEVGGSTVMKFSQGLGGYGPHGGYLLMLFCIGWSYYFLALSTLRLPVGVAFACWEGLGLTLITVCSVLVLGEAFTLTRAGALAAVLVGVMLIHQGTEHGDASSADPEVQAEQGTHPLAGTSGEVRS